MLIKDLVSSFLIPDVQRKKVQRQLQFEERKYLETARKTILMSVQNAGAKLDNENMLQYAQGQADAKAEKRDGAKADSKKAEE